MKKIIYVLTCCLALCFASLSLAAVSSADIRTQAIEISKELRCPSSMTQSLYESEAPIAAELKGLIYKKLAAGESKEQILTFLSERYGEQIRYEPAMNASTAMLWLFPAFLFLTIFFWFVIAVLPRKKLK